MKRILAILFVFVLPVVLAGCGMTGQSAALKAQNYVNKYFFGRDPNTKGMNSSVIDVREVGDLYYVNLQINKDGKPVDKYAVMVSKNGKTIIMNPAQGMTFDMSISPEDNIKLMMGKEISKAGKQKFKPKKTARPKVELWIMSGCPFGVVAENTMMPVLNHLGKQATKTFDLKTRFIVSACGKKSGNYARYCSLHGYGEAREDARQICIQKNNPDKFWPYLAEFNNRCANKGKFDDKCAGAALTKVGLKAASINACMKSSAKHFVSEAKDAQTNNVQGSPTLIINGKEFSGDRTPNGYLKAICAAYKKAPAACKKDIVGGDKAIAAGAANGGCGVK